MTPEDIADREHVWQRVAAEKPEFKRSYDLSGNYHAVREIVLGGSPAWAGVWRRFKPTSKTWVLDIGANAGIFSAYCAANGAEVMAYEPYPQNYNYLNVLNDYLPNLDIVDAAVWTYTGQCKFVGHERDGYYNGAPPVQGVQWVGEDEFDVLCVSLNDALSTLNWDCVKIDTEGSEFEILLAASPEKLKQIKFMFVEFHPWVPQDTYDKTIAKLEDVFKFEGTQKTNGRWDAAYLTRK